MSDCPFCSEAVINQQQIYQTKLLRVILESNPVAEGHCLIVTKRHVPSYSFLTPDEAEELSYLIKKVSLTLVRACRAEGYNILFNEGAAAGQTVPHFHLHVIPRRSSNPIINPKILLAEALHSGKPATAENLKSLQQKLVQEVY